MIIKAIAPWFGAKRILAPRIVELLGPHSVYWEPFCGSMAVLLVKPTCSMETVNDLHEDLVNLARVIRDPLDGPILYRRLRRTLMVEQLHWEARAKIEESFVPGPDRAYWYFVCSWIGMNGVAGTKYNNGFCVRYTSKGGHAARRVISCVQSIPAWRRRLRRVTILNKDGFEMLERIGDEAQMAIYVDPPYVTKGAKYVHDFESEDHERLAKLLKRFKQARIVVSYYDHPRVRELYEGWYCESHVLNKALASGGRRGHRPSQAIELLLVNQQPEKKWNVDLFGQAPAATERNAGIAAIEWGQNGKDES